MVEKGVRGADSLYIKVLLAVSELDRTSVLPREMDSQTGSFREDTGNILTIFKLEEESPS